VSKSQGQIITFYSFKGGVGRSMAVANVAAILAQQGKTVLALDFDFEAPGLHRYFLRAPDGAHETKRAEPDRAQRGVIDLFKALRKRLRERLPVGPHDAEDPATKREVRAIVEAVLESTAYRYRIHLQNPNHKDGSAALDFIAAGRFDEGYVGRVRSFGWKRFYDDYAEVFPILTEELAKRYDYVLIDSRTGFTDIGSICTMILPDKLVLVFSPNEQSLAGVLEVGEQAVRQRTSMGGDRGTLPLFPLLSRLEDSEEPCKREWVKRTTESFEKLFTDVYGLTPCDLEVYFDLARVLHRGYYAYGERIAAEEEKQHAPGSMAQAFKVFADCLEYDNAYDVRAPISWYEIRLSDTFSGRIEGNMGDVGLAIRAPSAADARLLFLDATHANPGDIIEVLPLSVNGE
jgi:cellulose biosynthesis protein BcsQ